MQIEIPESGRDALATLLEAKPSFLEALFTTLKDTRPTLAWRDSLVAELTLKLREHSEASPDSLRSIGRMLTGVLSWREDESASEIADDLIKAARSSGDERLLATPSDWDRLRPYLEKLLSLEQLQISAKARMLFTQTPRHLHMARVVTDARPIFTNKATEGPTAFVIVHTLSMEIHEDGEDKEWYLALDSADLENLRDTMDRAIQKESSLKGALQKTELPVLTLKEEQDATT
jgi:hypothetical protein